jgi:hypothetical protein
VEESPYIPGGKLDLNLWMNAAQLILLLSSSLLAFVWILRGDNGRTYVPLYLVNVCTLFNANRQIGVCYFEESECTRN